MLVIRSSGTAHGAGSDPFKWVSFLTARERQIVREGGRDGDGKAVVYVTEGVRAYAGNPPYRAVRYINGRYVHRIPTAIECTAIDAYCQEASNA